MARRILFGAVVSPGIAVGKVSRMRRPLSRFTRHFIMPEEVEDETVRLHTAIETAEAELARARDALPADLPEHREIIASHILMCRDPKLVRGSESFIRERFLSADRALEASSEKLCAAFDSMEDPYLRDRAQDIRTVIGRIRHCLYGNGHMPADRDSPAVLLAEELSPADAVEFRLGRILAVVTIKGGPMTHMSILARGLHIPALVNVGEIPDAAEEGELAVVDAFRGRLYLGPDEEELAAFVGRQEEYALWREEVRREAHLPAETEDGVRIEVQANIDSPEECAELSENGAEGVGLYRTEYTYLKMESLPDENTLYEEYSAALEACAPARVIFRTLDLGTDKPALRQAREKNPALGLRAVRYCLRHQDVFRTQLRALLRAGAKGNPALLLPLISGTAELEAVKRIVDESAAELRREGAPHAEKIPVGVMIEVPSAVMIADLLAERADFFSIGTNDLVQYLLAVDRGNTQVAHLYEPLHPAVLRALQQVIECARRKGISVAVCGEVAADPGCLPVLLGLGVNSLSAAPRFVPVIKRLIRRLRAEDCRKLVRAVAAADDASVANRLAFGALFEHLQGEAEFYVTLIGG